MPAIAGEEARLTILLGTTIILLFGIAIISLLTIFQKKSQLNQKEREIMKTAYEKAILQAQLEIQEQTFSVISSELHDNVGQVLSLAKVQINIMNESNDLNKEMLGAIKENIGKAMADLRDIAKGLSPERIQLVSLYHIVREELDRISHTGILTTGLCVEGQEKPLDGRKKLILFRIIQECIQNCLKHAQASCLRVTLLYLDEVLQVTVADDGKGFGQDGAPREEDGAPREQDGLGLLNMQRRAWLAGGDSRIESKPDKGTTIIISIPYE